jgi:hypothetical protein
MLAFRLVASDAAFLRALLVSGTHLVWGVASLTVCLRTGCIAGEGRHQPLHLLHLRGRGPGGAGGEDATGHVPAGEAQRSAVSSRCSCLLADEGAHQSSPLLQVASCPNCGGSGETSTPCDKCQGDGRVRGR